MLPVLLHYYYYYQGIQCKCVCECTITTNTHKKAKPDEHHSDNGDACLMFVVVVCKYDNNNVKAFRQVGIQTFFTVMTVCVCVYLLHVPMLIFCSHHQIFGQDYTLHTEQTNKNTEKKTITLL